MPVLENCEPKRVFHYFEEICKIPHGSGNTKQISDYLVKFAEDHGFKYVQDEMNNVIIYKPGTHTICLLICGFQGCSLRIGKRSPRWRRKIKKIRAAGNGSPKSLLKIIITLHLLI